MQRSKVLGILGAVLVLAGSALMALWAWPPDLLRVGANFTAKTICSNVFLAGRDPDQVLHTDVQAPGHPLLRLMRIRVDRERGVVRSGLFGFIGGGLAIVRPGVGCAVLPDGRIAQDDAPARGAGTATAAAAANSRAEAPMPEAPDGGVARIVEDDALAGVGVRAIVVLHDGRLIAERYTAGFDRNVPQAGWSMAKSVTAGLIGLLVKDGRLGLAQAAGWPAGDGRERITLAALMSMTSGLEFNEGYGAVSDATRMFYLESDMAAYARSKPLIHGIGEVWSYSSGTAVIVARLFQDTAGTQALEYMRTRLFEPLGMTSAVLETDASGTLVGSSYLYATPRDWARYGQLLAQDGLWQGQQILPPGYVATMAAPVPVSAGNYAQGMLWRRLTPAPADLAGSAPAGRTDPAAGLPDDLFWMSGHDGQYVAVSPSRGLVLVRMGLTPDRARYHPEPLVRAVLAAIG